MLCRKPFAKGGALFPCGQCLPCRYNRRRIWTHRIMLESLCHGDNAFVTLTIDDDHLVFPDGGLLPTLVPSDLTLFLKRFRKAVAPARIRFFAVGEYGDQSERPHYHLAIFGFPSCRRGNTVRSRATGKCCDVCDLVSDAWGKGLVYLGSLSPHSAGYVAGYVVKKMTAGDDMRLQGRYPEFSRMSRRPGLGAEFMHEVASTLLTHNLEALPDVPMALRHGAKELPLGRYLRMKLRKLIGRDEKTPEVVLKEMVASMQELRETWFESATFDGPSFSEAAVKSNDGKFAGFDSRSRIYRQRRSL